MTNCEWDDCTDKPTKEFSFWIGARRFSSDRKRLTGVEIKAISGTSPNYPLYRDTGPRVSDHVPFGDSELVDVEDAHFYALIPATMYKGIGE